MVVLASFIKSFSVINELAHKTETEVMEDYLVSYWDEAGFLGPMPVGSEAIAVMRLIVQAQTADKQVPIPNAFRGLSQEDKQVRPARPPCVPACCAARSTRRLQHDQT